MDNYAGQALNMYEQVPNAPPIKNGVHYPWLEPTMEQEAMETNGANYLRPLRRVIAYETFARSANGSSRYVLFHKLTF